MHLRHLIVVSAVVLVSALAAPATAHDFYATDIDRPGGDYRSFDTFDDAQACRQTCTREMPRCRAWTYVKAPAFWHGLQRPPARCWLKRVVPRARANPCCISGISGGQRID
ncbi:MULTISPECIES: PAN domain-containing protein [unclassified Bradyrhizobium]|uniref:PAN domain-containing protein n=1 Tax=unclassified Bradyrhizobium TaxID=2631580 RepID=UPI0028EAA4C4|nr:MULTISPECIES: PAN domain-containing protein [unclassified Bradyrhizobium]